MIVGEDQAEEEYIGPPKFDEEAIVDVEFQGVDDKDYHKDGCTLASLELWCQPKIQQVLVFKGIIEGKEMLTLVDSGSSLSFLSEEMVQKGLIKTTETTTVGLQWDENI